MTAWLRFVHTTNLLGYSLACALFNVVLLSGIAQMTWIRTNHDGLPVVNEETEGLMFGVIQTFIFMMGGWGAVAQAKDFTADGKTDGGPGYGVVLLALQPLFLIVGYGVVVSATQNMGADFVFYGIAYFTASICNGLFLVAQVLLRTAWAKSYRRRCAAAAGHPDSSSASSATPTEVAASSSAADPQHQDNTNLCSCYAWLPKLSGCFVFAVYPFFLVPYFSSSTTGIRMVIALVVHPIVLEACEAVVRAHSSALVHERLLDGTFDLEHAEAAIVQSYAGPPYLIKALMAFYRRYMLLNIGSAEATLAAIVAAAIEETLTRSFMVEIDQTIRHLSGQAPLEAEALRLQKLGWMADTNMSAIAEFIAIISSTFAYIAFEPHSLIFALGYDFTGAPVDWAAVLLALLLELVLEILVDNTATWTEEEHGIPVTEYFDRARSLYVVVMHGGFGASACLISLYGFLRRPTFVTCTSNEVCACVDSPQFHNTPYTSLCRFATGGTHAGGDSNRTSTDAAASNTSVAWSEPPGLLDGVDALAVVLALAS